MEYSKELHWKISKKWVKRFFIYSFTIVILIALALPMYSNYTDRSRVASVLMHLSEAKIAVSTVITKNEQGTPVIIDLDKTNLIPLNILKGEKSNDGHEIKLEHRYIDSNGAIHVLFSGLNIYIRLTPHIENEKIIWQCYGRPHKYMPAQCKN